jgi:PKD repeat protein
VNPTHAYGVPGNYTITLLAINYNCTTSFSVPITVVQFGVGIEETLDGSLSVYPNPSTGEFVLNFNLNSPTSGLVRVSDELGKIILQEPFTAKGGYLHSIDLSKAENGLYHLMIQSESGIHHTKLLLIK